MNDDFRIRLAVVIPLANEEQVVEELLVRVLGYLSPLDRIFCIVDLASKDNTRNKVELCATRDPRVIAIWAPENRCVVDAYFRGYTAALDSGAEWILEMDGGLSHQPEDIPRFTQHIGGGFDYVAGCRFMPGGSHTGSISRRLLSWGGSKLANIFLRTHMRDMTSGFEMFSRKAMQKVVTSGVRSRAHFFQTEIKYLLKDWRWVEVPIAYRATTPRVPAGSINESLKLLWKMHRESRASR